MIYTYGEILVGREVVNRRPYYILLIDCGIFVICDSRGIICGAYREKRFATIILKRIARSTKNEPKKEIDAKFQSLTDPDLKYFIGGIIGNKGAVIDILYAGFCPEGRYGRAINNKWYFVSTVVGTPASMSIYVILRGSVIIGVFDTYDEACLALLKSDSEEEIMSRTKSEYIFMQGLYLNLEYIDAIDRYV